LLSKWRDQPFQRYDVVTYYHEIAKNNEYHGARVVARVTKDAQGLLGRGSRPKNPRQSPLQISTYWGSTWLALYIREDE